MQAFGSDRVRLDGDRVVLSSRLDKGWVPRVPKTLTTAEFPGTAILWEEQYFEVVSATPLPQGVRYVLEPWTEHHAMRQTDRYDEAREVERLAEYRKALLREKHRKTANAMALLTGHLPAIVQNTMAEDLGLLPVKITIVSVIGEYVLMAGVIFWIVSYLMRQVPPPITLIVIAIYLMVENTIRWMMAWTQSRPIGSTLGMIAYLLYWPFARSAVSPFGTEKGWATPIGEPDAERAAADLLHTREPFVTLLPASDQERIARRFGYDHRRTGRSMAIVLLVFALLGVGSSVYSGAKISFITAMLLAAEQIARLTILPHRPAGSILGFLVRPTLRKLL